MKISVIRQKVILMALGMTFRGLGCSVAAKPTSSVPANEKAAVTKTAQTPLKPLANAPGSYQYRAPWYDEKEPLDGPPPRTKIKAEIRKMTMTVSLRQLDQNLMEIE